MYISKEYAEALEESREAARIYWLAAKAYRNMEIDDDAFMLAVAANKAAGVAFDIAFDKESNR